MTDFLIVGKCEECRYWDRVGNYGECQKGWGEKGPWFGCTEWKQRDVKLEEEHKGLQDAYYVLQHKYAVLLATLRDLSWERPPPLGVFRCQTCHATWTVDDLEEGNIPSHMPYCPMAAKVTLGGT